MLNKKMLKKATMITMTAACMGLLGNSVPVSAGIFSRQEEETKVTQNVALVLGTTKYFPAVSINTEELSSQIYDACYSYGRVAAVMADGSPFLAADYTIHAPDVKVNKAKKKQLASQYTSQILSAAAAVKPQTKETDTLNGITMAADVLRSIGNDSNRQMIIYGSGLDTTSVLNFAEQDLIHTPAEDIVKQLEGMHAIPDLSGISVTWIGLGQTCGEQSTLNSDYKYRLQELWREILLAGGISEDALVFNTSPLPEAESSGEDLPDCSTVPVVDEKITSSSTEKKDTGYEISEVTKWDGNSSLQFQGDEAAFIDAGAAVAELSPVAEYLQANPEKNIYIFGMTATMTGGDPGIELAEARANACRQVLLEQGVNEAQIKTVGLGQLDNPLRVHDVDENGKQIQELAQRNRAVVVVKAESDLVDTLLKCVEG